MAFLIGGIGCAGNGGSNGGGGGNQTVGVLSGYNAGTGYDLATGLGTVNVDNLVNQWP
jgi:hypothetical protein